MKKPIHPKAHLYKQLIKAKRYIDIHFKEQINLETIANQACFSKYYFHRVFKSSYGKTPLEYITYLRIEEAKSLLSKGLSSQDVCYAIGFESTSSFIKLFKRYTSMTPSEYASRAYAQTAKISQQPLQYIPIGYAEYLGWK